MEVVSLQHYQAIKQSCKSSHQILLQLLAVEVAMLAGSAAIELASLKTATVSASAVPLVPIIVAAVVAILVSASETTAVVVVLRP